MIQNQQSDYVKLIQDAGKGLLQVVNDVLDVSKVEAGKLEINIADCSLNKLLDDIESMMGPAAIERGLRLEVFKSANLPARIKTDSDRLFQCLLNLVSNAIKFTESGHVYIKVSTDTGNDSMIRFDVEDTGIGIESGKLENVFESFTQIDNSNTRQQTGTGLGLTITKHLVELLGGTISVSSEHGKGSIFSLIIPAGVDLKRQPNAELHLTAEEMSIDSNPRQFTGKVLIAEDYEGLRIHAKLLLESFGLETAIASDGKQAVEMSLADKFDLILMDLRMPILDGYQAVKELRDKKVAIPIIAVTAHATRGYKDICLSKGFDGYISKPIDNDQLTDILDKYLPIGENVT